MGLIRNSGVIWKALDEASKLVPDDKMYICKDRTISFSEMNETSDRVASWLLKKGIRKGDRIGIIALNQPEWLHVYFAAAKIGAAIVGLNVRYRDMELDYMLNQSETSLVVSLTEFGGFDYVKYFDSCRRKIPTVKDFVFIGDGGFPGSISYDSLLAEPVDANILDKVKSSVTPDDLMIIIYTSGTTGTPKGAAITHKSQLASAVAQVNHAGMKPDDCMLIIVPLNHVGGITCAVLSSLLAKTKGILIPFPDLNEIVEKAKKYQPTIYGGVPTLYSILFMHSDFLKLDFSNVRIAISGGSNAEPALLTQIKDAFQNAVVMNLYGLSETSGAVVLSPWESDFETTVRSIGKPIGDFQVKVINSQGDAVPPDEIGELCFKGDAVCSGYFRMPDATAESFDKDGWLHTGDMGFLDKEGYIVLKGRKKEMYVQGGFNVYPVEVENLIAKHPKVMMAADIGVPDPVLGEVGRCYIVPRPGVSPTAEEIVAYCKEHLADYKVPRQIVFKDALPMTPAGKVMKIKLKEELGKTGS
ncbi:MAG: AMP-binding protein [Syntrophales bacterium]|jgi:fatty-acyl-CoA synthase